MAPKAAKAGRPIPASTSSLSAPLAAGPTPSHPLRAAQACAQGRSAARQRPTASAPAASACWNEARRRSTQAVPAVRPSSASASSAAKFSWKGPKRISVSLRKKSWNRPLSALAATSAATSRREARGPSPSAGGSGGGTLLSHSPLATFTRARSTSETSRPSQRNSHSSSASTQAAAPAL